MSTIRNEVKKMEREIIVINAVSNETKKMRIAAYCRVSSDSQDQINSFLAQIKYYYQLIKNTENAILVDIYADEGLSGVSMDKREELKRLIKDCEKKKIDRVYVKSITRFARNSLECIEMIRNFKKNGVTIYFENDNIDTQYMNSEMLIYIKSMFAQEEAISASKRMRSSVKMRLENGTYKTSSFPYGYLKSEEGVKIVENEEKIVKLIYQLYLSGYGYSKITQYLQKTYPKVKWCQGHIQYILNNEKYIGDSLFQKSYHSDDIPFSKKINHGEKAKYYYHNTHPAMIEKDIFQKVQELKKQKRKVYFSNSHHNSSPLFNRILRCGECGSRYKSIRTKNDLHWKCSLMSLKNKNCCTPILSSTIIEKKFIHLFNKLKQNQKIILDNSIELYQKINKQLKNSENNLLRIDEEILLLNREKKEYEELFEMKIIDNLLYYQKTNQIKKKISELKNQKDRLRYEEDSEEFIQSLKKIKSILNNYPKYMTTFDDKIFSQMIEKIIVKEDKLCFLLKGGLELNSNII